MTDYRARTIVPFPGVPDGKIYGKNHVVGEIVTGDLARVAMEEKWAVPDDGTEAAAVQHESGQTETVPEPEADGGKPADGAEASAEIEIPDNWRTMKWFALKSFAEKIAGREIADSDEAKAVVETEIARRST
jgi:hypothetical protein